MVQHIKVKECQKTSGISGRGSLLEHLCYCLMFSVSAVHNFVFMRMADMYDSNVTVLLKKY